MTVMSSWVLLPKHPAIRRVTDKRRFSGYRNLVVARLARSTAELLVERDL